MAALPHPGIVSVYDVGRTEEGGVFFVIEFIDGGSLAELLESGPLSSSRSVELIAAIADAVDHVHRRGFVHRDLKPANVLIDAEGKPRVVDFGTAIHEDAQRSRVGERSGTPAYMAPEQARGETHRLDGRADIWALGAMLYEMLSGKRPFDGKTLGQITDEILHREPKPLRQINDRIPAELERICLKCLAKSVTDRYATAADLARDLRKSQKPRRHAIAIIGAAVVACVALFGVWYVAGRAPEAYDAESGPIAGNIDVVIWNERDPSRRRLALRDPGTLPLRPGDQIRIEAQLSRPAYTYLLWIDGNGNSTPIYPWTSGAWSELDQPEKPTDHLSLPAIADEGWEVKPPFGTETFVLLARDEPLAKDIQLGDVLAGMPSFEMQDSTQAIWFSDGKVITETEDELRGFDFSDSRPIDDALLTAQRILQQKLGPYFRLSRAVTFATEGE